MSTPTNFLKWVINVHCTSNEWTNSDVCTICNLTSPLQAFTAPFVTVQAYSFVSYTTTGLKLTIPQSKLCFKSTFSLTLSPVGRAKYFMTMFPILTFQFLYKLRKSGGVLGVTCRREIRHTCVCAGMSPKNVSKECGGRANRKTEDKEDKSEKTKSDRLGLRLPLRVCRLEQSMSLCIM